MFFRPVTDTLSELKTDSAYNSSVVLYASALLMKKKRYVEALNAIKAELAKKPNDSFKAWMWGRIVLAATHFGDKATVDEMLPELKSLLPQVAKDENYAWALGYLAAVNPKEYEQNKQAMMDAAKALKKPADALWAHVMNLQAAARQDEKADFYSILMDMRIYTGKTTIAEALAQIPATDWRAWALGIATESAAIMGDKDLYAELNQPIADAITEAVGAKSMANAMLAQINATKASELMQSSKLVLGN